MAMSIGDSIELNDTVSGSFKDINSSINVLINNIERINNTMNVTFNNTSIVNVMQNINVVNAELRETESRLEEIEEDSQKNAKSATNWSKVISKLGGVYNGLKDNVKKVLDLSDTTIKTKARLSLIADGSGVDELESKIMASAQRSRTSYQTTLDSILNLGNQASNAFKSNDEIVGFTELLNKSFVNSGTSAQGVEAVMAQITQAMADGTLEGEGFCSIMENVPMVADAIAEHMGVSKGELEELSSEGVITADIIKNSLFAICDDINSKFEQMPVTWEQLWVGFINNVTMFFDPIFVKLNELANSKFLQVFASGVVFALAMVSNLVVNVFNVIAKFAGFIANNWSWLQYVIYGVITALIVYNATMGIAWLTTLKSIASLIIKTICGFAEATSIFAMTVAQKGLNAALLACPISFIIIAVIALIAIIFAVCGAIAKFTGVANSAFGVICGVVAVAGAYIWNVFAGLINSIIQFLWTRFVEPWIGIIEWVLNVFNGGFDSFGGAVANLIGNIISWFLSLGKVVTKIIDAIFGTKWTDELNSLQDKVISWGKNENAITFSREAPNLMERIEYGQAWKAGAEFGDGISSKISGIFDFDGIEDGKTFDYDKIKNDYLFDEGNLNINGQEGDIGKNVGSIGEDTKEIAKNTQKTNELIELVKDNWEKKLIKEYTSKITNINYDFSKMNNTYNNAKDNFNPVKEVERYLRAKAAISTEGI